MKTYRIEITGFGAEICFGTISQEAYEYWQPKGDDDEGLISHLFWDPQDGTDGNEITEENDPRYLGEWHTLDDVEHAMGADKNTCCVSVFDENDELVWVTNKPVISNTDYVVSDSLKAGHYILVYNAAKGTFFSSEFEADSFDPEKLRFETTDFEGDNLINYVEYDDEVLDDFGGDSDGKGCGYSFIKKS